MTVSVSVIVAVRDGADHVERALDSVLASSHDDFELIVVDDGSTDDTPRILRRFEQFDERVTVVVQASAGGVSAAREAGVRRCSGTYVWFVDADDTVAADGMRRMVDAARRQRADVVIGASKVLGGRSADPYLRVDRWDGPEAVRALLRGEIRGQLWDKLIAGSIVRSVGIPQSRVHSDVALTARCLAAATTTIRIGDVVYFYVVRATSIIGSATGRAESLLTVERLVVDAAAAVGVVADRDIAYYRARFIGTSMIRDAAAGGYSDRDAAAIVEQGRRRIGWTAVMSSIGRRQWRVAASMGAARLDPRVFVWVRRFFRISR